MCIQNPDINDQRSRISGVQGCHIIAPSFNFTCNGRVTGVTAHLALVEVYSIYVTPGTELPVFQVWHPVLPGSSVYSIIGQVHFQSPVQINDNYSISTVLLTGDDQIEFQAGDVIASYHPTNPSHFMYFILDRRNYTSYVSFHTNRTATTTDVSTIYFDNREQPVFNITTGKYSYVHAMVMPNLVLYFRNELISLFRLHTFLNTNLDKFKHVTVYVCT